jgi:DNA-binding NarL/FixJ family response regulator
MSDSLIRVVLADDHSVVRAGLRLMLGVTRDIVVVGEAASGQEVVPLAARERPDVVLMDIGMAGLDGLGATTQIRALPAAPRVLILTMHPADEYLSRALAAGASGYVTKTAADRELLGAIRIVSRGDVYLPPTAGRVLARKLRPGDGGTDMASCYARLTERERTVLRLVAEGFTGPQIGQRLAISAKTVDTYRHRIQLKMGLAHRPDYVRAALSLGIMA